MIRGQFLTFEALALGEAGEATEKWRFTREKLDFKMVL
jgi:hypothetical protein